MNLAINAENQGLTLTIIDVEGTWKHIIPRLQKDVEYYEVDSNLKVNPFDLKDLGLTKMLLKGAVFGGIEKEYQELSPQMNFLLDRCMLRSKNMRELMENVIHYEPDLPFTMRNLDATRAGLLTRLNPYKDNPVLRKIFLVPRSSIDSGSFKDKNLIVDLHNLDRKVVYKRELRLIYNFVTTAYLREALSRPETSRVTRMFIADEAQLLVPKIFRKAVATDTWVTTDFATRLRKRGESLVVITQSPSNIEDDIRKNSQNMFVFRLQDPKDIRAIAGMMGSLQSSEATYYAYLLTTMENRRAIVKTSLAGNRFLVRSLDMYLQKISHVKLRSVAPEVDFREDLDEDELELRKSVKQHPFLPNTERACHLGWHRSRYSKARKCLLEKGILEEIRFKTKAKSAPSRFLKLRGQKSYGRGGFIHAYWVEQICDHLRKQGFEPVREFRVNGKVVDVAFEKNGERVFVEIEYESDWKSNMLRAKDLCDRLISVFVRKSDYVQARLFATHQGLRQVSVAHIHSLARLVPSPRP